MKKIIGIIIFLGAIFLGTQYMIPTFVNHQVEQNFYQNFEIEKADVNVNTFPAFYLLLGDIDNLNVELSGVKIKSGLRFEKLELRAKAIKYNLGELVKSHNLQISSMQDGKIEAILMQKDLNDFLQTKLSGIKNTEIKIENNVVLLKGDIDIAGMIKGHAKIKGNLFLNKNALVFSPLEFSIGGINILGINQSMLSDINIYNFNDFPVKVEAYKIVTENGKLHLFLKPEGI